MPDPMDELAEALETERRTRARRLWRALEASEDRRARLQSAALAPLGLTPAQARLLALLARGPRGLGELARALGVANGNVTVVVANLRKAGFVTRLTTQSDRRAARAKLTESGTEAAERATEAAEALDATLAGGLTPDEQEILARLLGKLIATMPETVLAPQVKSEADSHPADGLAW